MANAKKILLVFFGIFLLAACKKKDPVNSTGLITPTNITFPDFTGFTRTDNVGVIISEDTTDWRLDDVRGEVENYLFDQTVSYNDTCSNTFGINISPVYPNPSSQGVYNINFGLGGLGAIDLRIIDDTGNILYSGDGLITPAISFNDNLASPTSQMMRMYYRVIYNDSCAFYGHGDISLTF